MLAAAMGTRNQSRGHEAERFSAEALEQRLEQAHAVADLERQADRLVAEERDAAASNEGPADTRQQRRARERIAARREERVLHLLVRDDDAIRAALERRERIDDVLDGAAPAALDDLLWFLIHELKLTSALKALAVPSSSLDPTTNRLVKHRTMYAPLVLNLLSLMTRSLGITNGPEMQAMLLTDPRWMTLLGFDRDEVLLGSTRRSAERIGTTRNGEGGRFEAAGPLGPARARLDGPRGALSSQTIAEHEGALEAPALDAFFNAVVRAIARLGLLPTQIHGSLDSTCEEVCPSFEGAGRVSKKGKVASKARRPKEVKVSVLGFKVWFFMDGATGLPLAFAFDRIEVGDTRRAQALITQAKANVKGYATIASVALDRGFLDGDLLWWLHQKQEIRWYCPSKEKMHVTDEARTRVREALAAAAEPGETTEQTAQRLGRAAGASTGVRFFERATGPNRATLLLAQVDGLHGTDWYGPGGSDSSRVNAKSYRPTALHATVIVRWPDRSTADREDAATHDPASEDWVVLLSPTVEFGLARYDRYDARSLIENRMNREGKQHFGLGTSLARTEGAMRSATVFSTLALLLHRALEQHEARVQEIQDLRAETLGVLRYRRQQVLRTRGTILVVMGAQYGRLSIVELLRFTGLELGPKLRAPP